MHRHLLAATTTLALATGACSEGRAESGGPSTSRNYSVGRFDAIEVAGPFNVKVTTGQPIMVQARGSQKLLDATEVYVDGNKLVIRPKRSGWFGGMRWGSSEQATFMVAVPDLSSAEVAGSGDIDVDKVAGAKFSGSIAGSGNLRLPQVEVQELALEVAGSGGVMARGQARRAKYHIAGSGDLDASGLTASDASAEIAGSGSIKARATGTAKASIAGSGDIDVSGGAKCETSKAGSGSIRCS